ASVSFSPLRSSISASSFVSLSATSGRLSGLAGVSGLPPRGGAGGFAGGGAEEQDAEQQRFPHGDHLGAPITASGVPRSKSPAFVHEQGSLKHRRPPARTLPGRGSPRARAAGPGRPS